MSSVIVYYIIILLSLDILSFLFSVRAHRRPPVKRPNNDRKINRAWCCIRRREVTTVSEERDRRLLAATQKDLLRSGRVSDVKRVLKILFRVFIFPIQY